MGARGREELWTSRARNCRTRRWPGFAAIDFAKNSGVVCLRLPNETREGARTQKAWTVAATTNAILELGDHLVCQGVRSAAAAMAAEPAAGRLTRHGRARLSSAWDHSRPNSRARRTASLRRFTASFR
ncbi:hypothetical protein ACIHFB_27220 [Streptomyces sp. NPDC051963]|uniref:hypothetical protein n=1 Tax=Streptomyces sp. NPDC051963 TaxID=3365678 RepID=UPI0037CF9A61